MASASDIRAGRALVEIIADNSQLEAGLRQAQSKLAAFSAGVQSVGLTLAAAGAAMTGSIIAGAKALGDTGFAYIQMSRRTGMAVESLSALNYAAQRTGTSLESAETGVKHMQQALSDAAHGGVAASMAFVDLSLDVDELARLSPDEQFKQIAAAIAGIQTPAERTRLAMQLFGRSGTEIIPLAQNFDRLSEEARRTGKIMSGETAAGAAELHLSMEEVSDSTKRLFMGLGSAVLPTLKQYNAWLGTAAGTVRAFVAENGALITLALKTGMALAGAGMGLLGLSTAFRVGGTALATLRTAMAGIGGLSVSVAPLTTALGGLISTLGKLGTYASHPFQSLAMGMNSMVAAQRAMNAGPTAAGASASASLQSFGAIRQAGGWAVSSLPAAAPAALPPTIGGAFQTATNAMAGGMQRVGAALAPMASTVAGAASGLLGLLGPLAAVAAAGWLLAKCLTMLEEIEEAKRAKAETDSRTAQMAADREKKQEAYGNTTYEDEMGALKGKIVANMAENNGSQAGVSQVIQDFFDEAKANQDSRHDPRQRQAGANQEAVARRAMGFSEEHVQNIFDTAQNEHQEQYVAAAQRGPEWAAEVEKRKKATAEFMRWEEEQEEARGERAQERADRRLEAQDTSAAVEKSAAAVAKLRDEYEAARKEAEKLRKAAEDPSADVYGNPKTQTIKIRENLAATNAEEKAKNLGGRLQRAEGAHDSAEDAQVARQEQMHQEQLAFASSDRGKQHGTSDWLEEMQFGAKQRMTEATGGPAGGQQLYESVAAEFKAAMESQKQKRGDVIAAQATAKGSGKQTDIDTAKQKLEDLGYAERRTDVLGQRLNRVGEEIASGRFMPRNEVAGTFNATAAAQMGYGAQAASERTAIEAAKIAENTQTIAELLRRGGMIHD